MRELGWRIARLAAAALCCSASAPRQSLAETLSSALARAYVGNPDLNQQRANVRVRDEDVPKAAAGMLPKASASVNGGPQFTRIRQPAGRDANNHRLFSSDRMFGEPRGASFGLSQPLYDGGRTGNSVRQAEAGVFAARATMQLAEQATLLNGATAYMNVLHDAAVQSLRRNNILVLEEQLRQTRDRLQVGEVTITDVAQAEAALAQARSDAYAARSALMSSAAAYRQIFGVEPGRLEPAQPIERRLPKGLVDAIEVALAEHPAIIAALRQADAAEFAAKVAEGALLPTVSVGVQVNQQIDSYLGYPGSRQFSAQASGIVNVPIYQGGAEYASIRQAKEQLGQARLNVDVQRDAVRAAVVSSFAQLETAKASIVSGQTTVRAAEVALRGVRNEVQFGQRTTLDLLNAQQALLNARVNLLTSQRDRVVSSYALLGAIGRLSAARLGLDVAIYEPNVHFDHVSDKWIGFDSVTGQ